ncbi:hypothetical protein PTKIN_Ptkin01aG0241900 [Pterospermum kingtungense]
MATPHTLDCRGPTLAFRLRLFFINFFSYFHIFIFLFFLLCRASSIINHLLILVGYKYLQGLAAMDSSLLLKQSMEEYLEGFLLTDHPLHSRKRSTDTSSAADDDNWRPGSHTAQPWETTLIPWFQQSNNQPGNGINNGVVPNQTNVSLVSQSPNIPSSSVLKRNYSSLSENDRAERKRLIDQAYRKRLKRNKEEMHLNLGTLKVENESLKEENESLKSDNALMNETLTNQTKEIDRLRSDLFQLKREHEKQNVLVQTLSRLLADPVRLENEKLKDENASLRKNVNLNNLALLAEENAKLRIENKVLQVQNDALCGKIISDNENKHEQ